MDSQVETVASTIVEGLRINICGHMYIRWYHIMTDKTKICMIIIMHTYGTLLFIKTLQCL